VGVIAPYEPFGHVQHLLRIEEKDRKEKENIAMQLIEEEEAAKKAAEKKKKKKKKKGQVGLGVAARSRAIGSPLGTEAGARGRC